MNKFISMVLIGIVLGCNTLVKYDPIVLTQFPKPLKMSITVNPMLFHGIGKKPVATEFFTIKSQMNGLLLDLRSIAQREGLDYFIMAFPTVSSSRKVGSYIETTTAYQESYVYPKDKEDLATNDSDRIFIVSKIPASFFESLVKITQEQIYTKDANYWISINNKDEANSSLEIIPNYSHNSSSVANYISELTIVWIEMILKSKNGNEIMRCKSNTYSPHTFEIIHEMKKPEDKYIQDYLLDGYRRDPNYHSKAMRTMIRECMAEMSKALKEP